MYQSNSLTLKKTQSMKKIKILNISSFLFATLFFTGQLFAQFINGQSADLVLGQPDFTTISDATTASKMYDPYGQAFHPVSGKFYVADGSNNRILRFPSVLSSSMNAEAVLGQSDFISSSSTTSASKLSFPSGTHIDKDGNLWVADYSNYRVLMFKNVATLSNIVSADLVLGQANFDSAVLGSANQSNFDSGLEGIFVDNNGRLWVADYGNGRVLWFNNAANLANGAPADGVLGQTDFTSTSGGVTASLMNGASGVFVDKDDRLWVADYSNNRVLRFDNASNLPATGAVANSVLGQPDFTSSTDGPTQSLMYGPNRLYVDSMGTLWVVEYSSHRILGYYNAAEKANGAPADIVLGQPNFISGNSGSDEKSLDNPIEITVDFQGRLLVADYGNNRILRFSHPAAQPDARVTYKKKTKGKNKINATGKRQKLLIDMLKGRKKLQVTFNIKNNSTLNPDAFKIIGSNFNKKAFKIRYYHKGTEVTNLITSGEFLLKNINPGETGKIIAKISTRSSDSLLNRKIKLSAESTIDSALVDVVRAHIRR